MEVFTVIVGPDGRVVIPGTQPGQTITIHFELEEVPDQGAAVLTPEEQVRVIQKLLDGGRRVRETAAPE
jgi:hypothetical protein